MYNVKVSNKFKYCYGLKILNSNHGLSKRVSTLKKLIKHKKKRILFKCFQRLINFVYLCILKLT